MYIVKRILFCLVGAYILGSVAISVMYNAAGYWGSPRYGLLAVGVDVMTMVRLEGDNVWGAGEDGGGVYDGSRFSISDRVLSIYIFNPFTNYSDDAIRFDFKL